jgi:hypothetical protein
MNKKGIIKWLVLTTVASFLFASAAVFGGIWVDGLSKNDGSLLLTKLLEPDRQSVESCESVTLRMLKSPATYRRAVALNSLNDSVTISFDSQNGVGALIRSQVICIFDKAGIIIGIKLNDQTMLVDSLGNIVKTPK